MATNEDIKCRKIVQLFESQYSPNDPQSIIQLDLKHNDNYSSNHIACAMKLIRFSKPEMVFTYSVMPGILIANSQGTQYLVSVLPFSRSLYNLFSKRFIV